MQLLSKLRSCGWQTAQIVVGNRPDPLLLALLHYAL
jgi:hypothetical protein